ncbi:MAG: hypothetical protein U0M06_12825 [Clostridia bacterium]|nr:hypothetical protein [Clostridia bacterium]
MKKIIALAIALVMLSILCVFSVSAQTLLPINPVVRILPGVLVSANHNSDAGTTPDVNPDVNPDVEPDVDPDVPEENLEAGIGDIEIAYTTIFG